MLISKNSKYIKTPFDSEDELEQVVISNYEHLFGPNSIYLPKKLIRTGDGAGTIPDGFAIDLSESSWYLVEAELLHHTVWNHIAPQVSKQTIAAMQPLSRKIIEDLAVKIYQDDDSAKEKFSEQGIEEIDVRKVLGEILQKEPIIGIPIDAVSNDLKEWARTLRYSVKLWVITKYVEFQGGGAIIYELPEEHRPVLDTGISEDLSNDYSNGIAQYDATLNDLINAGLVNVGDILIMDYTPRYGETRRYEAEVLEAGNLRLLGQVFESLSYAALAGINDAGSDRNTVNGWRVWKNHSGQKLKEIRQQFLDNQN